jgi:hypothetical protein
MDKNLYKKIKYPIHLIKSDEEVFEFPDLVPFKELFQTPDGKSLDPAFVLKYLILMYSPGSPAIDQQKHVGKRKNWVMKELGIETGPEGRYPPAIEFMLLNKVPSVNKKSVVFRSLQYPIDFQIMIHAESELHKWLEFSQTDDYKDLTVEDSLKLRQLIEQTRKQYEEAKDRLMQKEAKIIEEYQLEVFVAQSYLNVRPEETWAIIPKVPAVPSRAKSQSVYKDASA